jgi:hypothetical protein
MLKTIIFKSLPGDAREGSAKREFFAAAACADNKVKFKIAKFGR